MIYQPIHCLEFFCCVGTPCACECSNCEAARKREAAPDCKPCLGTGLDLNKPRLTCGCRPSCEECHGLGKVYP